MNELCPEATRQDASPHGPVIQRERTPVAQLEAGRALPKQTPIVNRMAGSNHFSTMNPARAPIVVMQKLGYDMTKKTPAPDVSIYDIHNPQGTSFASIRIHVELKMSLDDDRRYSWEAIRT